MEKCKFVKILDLLVQWKDKSEVLESQGIDIYALGDELERANKILLDELVGSKVEDWVAWWLAETDGDRYVIPSGSFERIELSTPEDLYEYLFNEELI